MSIWVVKKLSIMYSQRSTSEVKKTGGKWITTGSHRWKRELKAREVFAVDM